MLNYNCGGKKACEIVETETRYANMIYFLEAFFFSTPVICY